ncbi:hypothetical protein MJO28_002468 [Puccinia striiformis f. sp. tritici]|uniref:Uncharacterized protein n=1 Tax=Puccinia striiformis f. sp. tritici TaxID=168172 RepID=A0ACC0EPW6_9BASI|nr:hypothetical protein MJO28_002468 [Puccinia striiformis f. sp. tritici]
MNRISNRVAACRSVHKLTGASTHACDLRAMRIGTIVDRDIYGSKHSHDPEPQSILELIILTLPPSATAAKEKMQMQTTPIVRVHASIDPSWSLQIAMKGWLRIDGFGWPLGKNSSTPTSKLSSSSSQRYQAPSKQDGS